MEFAWRLACEPSVGPRWRYGGYAPAFESFASEFWRDVLSHLVVVRTDRPSEALGLVTLYGANFPLQHLYLGAAVLPTGTGIGAIAGLLGLAYAFETWPLRKVYLETHEENFNQFGSGEGKAFDVEARIPGHQWWGGRWLSKIVLATYETHYRSYILPTLDNLGYSSPRLTSGLSSERSLDR